MLQYNYIFFFIAIVLIFMGLLLLKLKMLWRNEKKNSRKDIIKKDNPNERG